jgi:DNA-binding transcriptional LysR family regulator
MRKDESESLNDQRAINVSHLITLSLVAHYHSFSRAAEALNVSQPSVSQQIRELERNVGLPVVISQGRSIKITALGADLAEIGRRIAVERERALRVAENHRSGMGGTLVLAASMTTSAYVLPAVISDLAALLPEAMIELRVANTYDVAQLVSDDVADIGVVEGQIERPELMVTPFSSDTMVCIAPPSFRSRDVLEAEDVRNESLLLREDGSGTRQVVAETLAARGFAFKRTIAFGSNESIKAGVHYGLGIAWLSRRAVEAELQSGRLCELRFDTPPIERELSYVRRRDIKPSPLGEAFIAALIGNATSVA